MEPTKVCTKCKQEKPLTAFSINNRRGRIEIRAWCKDCCSQYTRYNYSTNPVCNSRQKQWAKTTYYRLKSAVLEAYGGKCVCCGETEPAFLTVHHVNNDGAEKRRSGEHGLGGAFYLYLKRRSFPQDEFQLLCWNCNCARKYNGVCPHEVKRALAAQASK